ncbi:hypothetical protein LBMAG50_12410 [Phycisphaerae bacterium]|nr:hypothetical protein LBMAG50_12410 [Phycisphaerae bacterium]
MNFAIQIYAHFKAHVVAQMQYSACTTMTVNNTTAKGSVFRTSSRSNSDVMPAYATYGAVNTFTVHPKRERLNTLTHFRLAPHR